MPDNRVIEVVATVTITLPYSPEEYTKLVAEHSGSPEETLREHANAAHGLLLGVLEDSLEEDCIINVTAEATLVS